MSTGGAFYLIMVIAGFTGFALVLAYYSRQQGRLERERAHVAAQAAAPHEDADAPPPMLDAAA